MARSVPSGVEKQGDPASRQELKQPVRVSEGECSVGKLV